MKLNKLNKLMIAILFSVIIISSSPSKSKAQTKEETKNSSVNITLDADNETGEEKCIIKIVVEEDGVKKEIEREFSTIKEAHEFMKMRGHSMHNIDGKGIKKIKIKTSDAEHEFQINSQNNPNSAKKRINVVHVNEENTDDSTFFDFEYEFDDESGEHIKKVIIIKSDGEEFNNEKMKEIDKMLEEEGIDTKEFHQHLSKGKHSSPDCFKDSLVYEILLDSNKSENIEIIKIDRDNKIMWMNRNDGELYEISATDVHKKVEITEKNGKRIIRIEKRIKIEITNASAEELKVIGENEDDLKRNILNADKFEVYPNPTNESVHVSFELADKGDTEVKLYDIQGKVLFKESLMNFKGKYEKNINLDGVVEGNYLLSVTQNGQKMVKKIINQ